MASVRAKSAFDADEAINPPPGAFAKLYSLLNQPEQLEHLAAGIR